MPESVMLTISNDGLQVKVTSWEELINWIGEESRNWSWMNNNDSYPVAIGRTFQNIWREMISGCTHERDRGRSVSSAQSQLSPLSGGQVIYSGSKNGRLVFDILSDVGEVEAASAAAFLTKNANLSQAQEVCSLRGMLLVALPDLQKVTVMEERLRKERASFRGSLRRSVEEASLANEGHSSEFANLLRRARRLGLSFLRNQRERDEKRASYYNSQFDEARNSFKETESTYREYMKLRAPVEYWEKKASDHKSKKIIAFKNLWKYFVLMGVVTGAMFIIAGFLVYHISQGNAENPLALYLLISGGLAILSTIGFWFGRLLTKLYLSEHHLETDAEERSVMARTFLAFINEEATNESDKSIILAALFRATQDGIIKDDGPPDIAIQSQMARLFSGGRG